MTETESYLRDMAALDVEKIVFSSPCGENTYKKNVHPTLKGWLSGRAFHRKAGVSREFSGKFAGGEAERPVPDAV